jgi:hypothetical protein
MASFVPALDRKSLNSEPEAQPVFTH